MNKLTYNQFFKEVDKLKSKAAKINKVSGHIMVMVVTRIRKKLSTDMGIAKQTKK